MVRRGGGRGGRLLLPRPLPPLPRVHEHVVVLVGAVAILDIEVGNLSERVGGRGGGGGGEGKRGLS